MTSPTVIAGIRTWTGTKGGTPAGAEARLVSEARERFRVPPGESPEWRDLRTRWPWGAALLVDYVQRSLPHSGLTPEEYGDVIHELYQQERPSYLFLSLTNTNTQKPTYYFL